MNGDTVEMQRRTLELRKYAAAIGVGATSLSTLSVEHQRDFLTKNLIERLELDILSDKIHTDTQDATYSYEVYATPWQHFKDLHMPEWFVARYPVRRSNKSGTVKVKFDRYAIYPKANIALQRDRHFYEVMLGGFEAIHDNVEQIR